MHATKNLNERKHCLIGHFSLKMRKGMLPADSDETHPEPDRNRLKPGHVTTIWRATLRGFGLVIASWAVACNAGCGINRLQPVRVDLSRVPAAWTIHNAIPQKGTSVSPVSTAGGASLPAESQTIVGDPPMVADQNASRDVAAIGNTIKKEMIATSKDVFLRFRSILLRRLNDKKFADQQKLDQQQTADQQKATDQVSALYRAYASKRFPLLVHLSSLTGFPDPDPKSQKEPGTTLSAQDRFHTTIVQLRQQIHELDVEFKSKMNEIMAAQTARSQELQNQLNAAYLNDLNNLDALAKEEAAKVAGRSEGEIKPLLIDQAQSIIPGVAANTLELPASPAVERRIIPHPNLQERFLSPRATEAALNTWLRLNGYRLSKDSRDPDKTNQFAQWIHTFQPETSN